MGLWPVEVFQKALFGRLEEAVLSLFPASSATLVCFNS